jgi:glycosyltransferase involved in cell wall biosynthesis
MKYSIVIPTYNNCDKYLKPCIDSIFKWTDLTDVELVISANGCTDNTYWYLQSLKNQFDAIGFSSHFKVVWDDKPLGYAKATNEGIKAATGQRIVLLNNDTVFLEQPKTCWLELFEKPFQDNPKCGISCVIKGPSEPAGRDFAVFFCVMVDRKVFDKIGLLNEEYGVGGGEDTEFCIEAEKAGFEVQEVLTKTWDGTQYTGWFPIYHKGEGTMHDPNLVQGWDNIFLRNSLKLAKKYNFEWYRWRLSNYWERAVFLKGDHVFPREVTRYKWANDNLVGKKVLEIGCSNGYGTQFFPQDIDYTGVDYDPIIVEVAKEQGWGDHTKFFNADINQFPLEQYDSIVAFEVIEHIDNGLEVVERLKKHCKRLMITVPMNEPVGFWGPHHKLHGLNESHFPGFEFNYINEAGEISAVAHPISDTNHLNLMICRWTNG